MLQISLDLTPRGPQCNVIFLHWDADSLYRLTLPQVRHHDGSCEDGIGTVAGARPLEKKNVSVGGKGGLKISGQTLPLPYLMGRIKSRA